VRLTMRLCLLSLNVALPQYQESSSPSGLIGITISSSLLNGSLSSVTYNSSLEVTKIGYHKLGRFDRGALTPVALRLSATLYKPYSSSRQSFISSSSIGNRPKSKLSFDLA